MGVNPAIYLTIVVNAGEPLNPTSCIYSPHIHRFSFAALVWFTFAERTHVPTTMYNGPIKDEHHRAAVDLMCKLHASLQDFARYSFSLPAREMLEPFKWKPDLLSARLSQAALQASPAIAYFEDPVDYQLRVQKPWDWLRTHQCEKGPLGSWYHHLDPIFKGFPEEGVPLSTENDPKQTPVSCLTGVCLVHAYSFHI